MTVVRPNLKITSGFADGEDGWGSAMNANLDAIDAASPTSILSYGAVGDGVTDDTAALVAAHAALPSTGGVILAPYRHLISSTVTFTKPIILRGLGFKADAASLSPSAIIKKSTATGYALVFQGEGSGLEKLIIQGQAGNSGNGVQLRCTRSHATRVAIFGMGGSGLVIGEVGTVLNGNIWTLLHVICRSNGADGCIIGSDDGVGGPNTNGGTATNLSCQFNGGKGLRINGGAMNLFAGLHTESNTGEGVYLEGNSDQNVFLGGDQEGNAPAAGNIQVRNAGPSCNDNVFAWCGIQGGIAGFATVAAQRNTVLIPGTVRLTDGASAEAWSNGPTGCQGAGDSGNGGWWSFYADAVERLRIGVRTTQVGDSVSWASIVPGSLSYDVQNSRVVLASRTNANHKTRLAAGVGGAAYVEVDDQNASALNRKIATNCNLSLEGSGAGAWNGHHVIMGAYHLWVDASGRLRIKSGAPTSDTDGGVVGLQT